MLNKFDKLKDFLIRINEQGICLAFSGGIDSTLLLYLCKDLNTLAVTFSSEFQTDEEIGLTQILCKKYGVKHLIKTFKPLENENILHNPKDRCYHCKKLFFSQLKQIAGSKYIIDGTNFDDLSVYRPGLKVLEELNISSPLAQFEITKREIREYSKNIGIEIYNKPSAPCIATRFPYGTILKNESIKIVKEGENILKNFGFSENRLRLHNNIARIEIPQTDFDNFLIQRKNITEKLKSLGIKYITLDIEGLRSGSMDII